MFNKEVDLLPNTETALQYGLALRGKICYSMSYRLGERSMDCSSFRIPLADCGWLSSEKCFYRQHGDTLWIKRNFTERN